jgi:hypothetical protein
LYIHDFRFIMFSNFCHQRNVRCGFYFSGLHPVACIDEGHRILLSQQIYFWSVTCFSSSTIFRREHTIWKNLAGYK